MSNNIIDKFEEECLISLDYFYHSTDYNKHKYKSILTDGIKCNKLLNNFWGGTYNGLYYISLSKITIPDNECFLSYSKNRPSFIISGISPIKCEDNDSYEYYIYTEDSRRTGIDDEYQYYYFIKNTYIVGIVYNLYDCFIENGNCFSKKSLKNCLELINLLDEINIKMPIYDYSRRENIMAHEINKEKIKYYSKKLL